MTTEDLLRRGRWSPDLGSHRVLADGRTVALLAPDATVRWWCAPDVDDTPLCWQLLDPDGGAAGFRDLTFVDRGDAPAAATARTWLRAPGGSDGTGGTVEVLDGLVRSGDGVALVRLVRRARPPRDPRHGTDGPEADGPRAVEHELRLGGFGAEGVDLAVDGATASGEHSSRGGRRAVVVHGDRHRVEDGRLVTSLDLVGQAWSVLVVAVDADVEPDADDLARRLLGRQDEEDADLRSARLPRIHPGRAVDALAVVRACRYEPTGAVVAAPTTSLPEAVGHDRQFDYRYTWLRDASLSTAVAALLGKAGDGQRYLQFVERAWQGRDVPSTPVLDVRGEHVPAEAEVDGVSGWGASRPVRVGNDARGQRQYDAVGLLVEAVSVHVQAGGRLEPGTWRLVTDLAEQVCDDDPGQSRTSNGMWELREGRQLVDADIGRWLVLDRAIWIARGWRPLTRRRRWLRARDTIARRVLAELDGAGSLPQAYDGETARTDASSLMAVAFGLVRPGDPRAGRLVDAVLADLGAGPYVYRYPPTTGDGFSGREGAFLPMSFLAVTALARIGRVDEASQRLDALCAGLPRLLSEEVEPTTGRLLGNVPLVWSHAELARAVYVLDAALRRRRWGAVGLWAWRLTRYARLRRQQRRGS